MSCVNKCYIFVIMRQYFFPCEALTGQIIGPILAHAHPMPAAQTGKEESPVSRLHCEMSGAQAEQPSDRLSGSFLIPGKEGEHASAFAEGRTGILHGMKTYILQDEDGLIKTAYSISAGLDYPGVGPEHSYLKDSGRVIYTSVTDDESIEAFKTLCRYEGIMPAIESSHALAAALKEAPKMRNDEIIVVNLSGRGDKDVHTVAKYLGKKF